MELGTCRGKDQETEDKAIENIQTEGRRQA